MLDFMILYNNNCNLINLQSFIVVYNNIVELPQKIYDLVNFVYK